MVKRSVLLTFLSLKTMLLSSITKTRHLCVPLRLDPVSKQVRVLEARFHASIFLHHHWRFRKFLSGFSLILPSFCDSFNGSWCFESWGLNAVLLFIVPLEVLSIKFHRCIVTQCDRTFLSVIFNRNICLGNQVLKIMFVLELNSITSGVVLFFEDLLKISWLLKDQSETHLPQSENCNFDQLSNQQQSKPSAFFIKCSHRLATEQAVLFSESSILAK